MSKLSVLLLTFALLMPIPAFALSCGDTLTADVRLTADLHCTTGLAALHVRTSGVTIDLNGHTLSGSPRIPGIHIYDASNVTIIGPGRIRGFSIGVYGTRSHELKVIGIDFEDIVAGASISHSLKNTFVGNTFARTDSVALAFFDNSTVEPRRGLYRHNVAENTFTDVFGGVLLCGVETGGSVIANNAFSRTNEFAIHLRESSDYNTIRSNVIADAGASGILLRTSSLNTIEDNRIETGNVGILIHAGFGSCNRPPTAPAAHSNMIVKNAIRGQVVGIQFGDGGAGTTVYKNVARGNDLQSEFVGMHFRLDAVSNGGLSNDYTGTSIPFIDENGFNIH